MDMESHREVQAFRAASSLPVPRLSWVEIRMDPGLFPLDQLLLQLLLPAPHAGPLSLLEPPTPDRQAAITAG